MIFAFPTGTALSAKTATKGTGIPVLFAHGEAVAIGLVDNISNPGGNVTGCRTNPAQTTVRNFEILLKLAPKVKNVYLAYDPKYANAEATLNLLRPEASSSGITLVEDTVNNLGELKNALQKQGKKDSIGIDAILVMPDPFNYSPDGFSIILEFGKKHNIPIGGGTISMADKGSLFSNFPDNIKTGKAVAVLADKIFKGTKPGTIPIITPDDYLKINYKVARQLGLEVSESMLLIADEVMR
jgi:putative ABC transport system substrate-binding protein